MIPQLAAFEARSVWSFCILVHVHSSFNCSLINLCLSNLSGYRTCQVQLTALGTYFCPAAYRRYLWCSTRALSTVGQFNNKAVLNRQDEEVPDQEELDEISENEAEEEEEFCAGKSLWETEESLNSQLHVEIEKVKSRAFWTERCVKLPSLWDAVELTDNSSYLKVHHWCLNVYLPENF